MRGFIQVMGLWTLMSLAACGGSGEASDKAGFLSDIAGVWRSSDGTLFSIVYAEKKFRLLADEVSVPVSVGEVDEENETANLNVTLANGKPGIWTLRRIWDDEKTSFHLLITLNDGAQDELSFVRKISSDDLNRIEVAETNIRAADVSHAAAVQAEPAVSAPPAEQGLAASKADDHAITSPESAAPATVTASRIEEIKFAPSYDCAKATTGAERLICSSRKLAEADVKLMQAYKNALALSADKTALKQSQRDWNQSIRDACSDEDCMLSAYSIRIAELVE